jgi:hypothetical protein
MMKGYVTEVFVDVKDDVCVGYVADGGLCYPCSFPVG